MKLSRILITFWLNVAGLIFLVVLLTRFSSFLNPAPPPEPSLPAISTDAPPSGMQLTLGVAPAPASAPDAAVLHRIKKLESQYGGLEERVNTSFPNIYEKTASDLATVGTILTILAAVLGTVAGVAAAVNYLPNFKDEVEKGALAETRSAVDELEKYIHARIEFASSVDLATAAWDWEKDFEPTPIIHLSSEMFRRTETAIKSFEGLAKGELSKRYKEESDYLLGSALNNMVFFTCRMDDPKNGWKVFQYARDLAKRKDFLERNNLVNTYIYARIIYRSQFAARLGKTRNYITKEIERDILLQESKSLTDAERHELAWLQKELQARP